MYAKNDKIYPAYVSKYNWEREEQVIILIIPNKKECDCTAVKNLSTLLRGVASKHNGDYYFLNCLYSLRTKDKLKSHIKPYENKSFCNAVMSSEDTKILEFGKCHKSDKAQFSIYADLESINGKVNLPINGTDTGMYK